MIEFFKKNKEKRKKYLEIEKIKQQINVKLFSENGYVFYTDIISFTESIGKMTGIDLIEDVVLMDDILMEAYDSNWELEEQIISQKYLERYRIRFREGSLVNLFQKNKVRVYDTIKTTFENDVEMFKYKYNPAPLIGDIGYIIKVNGEVIKKIVTGYY
jgi:hypothetical protein